MNKRGSRAALILLLYDIKVSTVILYKLFSRLLKTTLMTLALRNPRGTNKGCAARDHLLQVSSSIDAYKILRGF